MLHSLRRYVDGRRRSFVRPSVGRSVVIPRSTAAVWNLTPSFSYYNVSVWNLEAERYQMQFYGSKCSKNDDQIIMWGTFEFLLQIDKKVYYLLVSMEASVWKFEEFSVTQNFMWNQFWKM